MRDTMISFHPDSKFAEVETGDERLLREIETCKGTGNVREVQSFRDGSKRIFLPVKYIHFSSGDTNFSTGASR